MAEKVVLITGASAGIGAVTAQLLAGKGWRVAINYLSNDAAARAVLERCTATGSEAMLLQGDVSDDAACRAMVAAVEQRWGRIDALVNNAGVTKHVAMADLEALPSSEFERLIRANVSSAFQMARAAAPALRRARGAIVNVSSYAGISGQGSSIAYAASKGAMNTLTLSLARVLAPEVRVNAIAPGMVETRWHDAIGAERRAKQAEMYSSKAALRRTVRPEDVADAVCWFIDNAPATTGQIVAVDSGHHLG
jgi:3-oxoacyl-[acyl-carrier protein] reductase